MESTWVERDLPVLDALVQQVDAAGGASFPELRDITDETGLDVTDISKAALALDSAGYITLERTMGPVGSWYVKRISKEARQAVGQWPTAEQLIDTLIQRLGEAADEEADPEQRSRLREAADTAGGVARNVFVDVLSSVIAKSMGA
ncbi:hypothetical protein G5C60_28645 [Streptomyces sp. HC44]|uniref:Uncharacterized protein n=1 Tax=Streptomyces scabichelini TaxID=2711217 RepID=A0A6G4VC36_9ACTN|nr:hypothetical protein [Streptomyces scabichelini]NGO11465.1 hypothetical protein [Streptomyces scabichelini]